MSRLEIRSKFDEIVSFAEIEKFLDTPVKRYSSGMYVRLAFAVAAHLEPEILIVDEVLAVGDVQFQKKCLGKMEEVSVKHGRTILFVSHNMGVLSTFCKTGILLDKGRLVKQDSVGVIIPYYFDMAKGKAEDKVSVEILPFSQGDSWTMGSSIKVRVSWDSNEFENGCICDLAFYTLDGTKVFGLQSDKLTPEPLISKTVNSAVFEIENIGLVDRELRLDVGLKSGVHENYQVLVENALTISVPAEKLYNHKINDAIIVPPARLIC
jgi:lipopolysaccharide transport system ATP-binding protein